MSAAPGRPEQARTAGTPVGASVKVLDLAAGRDHSLVLREDSVLLGWGGDGTGRFPPPAGVCTAPDAAGAAVRIASAATSAPDTIDSAAPIERSCNAI